MRLEYKKTLITFVEANEYVAAYGQTDYHNANLSLASGWWQVKSCAENVIITYEMPCRPGGAVTLHTLESVGDVTPILIANGIYKFSGLVLLSYMVGPALMVSKNTYEQVSNTVGDGGGTDVSTDTISAVASPSPIISIFTVGDSGGGGLPEPPI